MVNVRVFAALLIGACLHADVFSENLSEARCKKWGIQFAEEQTVSEPGQCNQVTCTKATLNEVSIQECPVFDLIPGCRVTREDLSKEYPNCCPQAICPGA